MQGLAHTDGRASKRALVRDEILGMLDELDVGDALPSEFAGQVATVKG